MKNIKTQAAITCKSSNSQSSGAWARLDNKVDTVCELPFPNRCSGLIIQKVLSIAVSTIANSNTNQYITEKTSQSDTTFRTMFMVIPTDVCGSYKALFFHHFPHAFIYFLKAANLSRSCSETIQSYFSIQQICGSIVETVYRTLALRTSIWG